MSKKKYQKNEGDSEGDLEGDHGDKNLTDSEKDTKIAPLTGEIEMSEKPQENTEKPRKVEPQKIEVEKAEPAHGLKSSHGLKLTARQFTLAKNLRWERAAGFIHWAKETHGASHKLTTTEWAPIWDGFLNRPIR